ncbi:MAG TPA: PASTA domain-containing protein [Solirubrobacteraceae bacterium]|nr:PASTA domain-containing protein [Solirubrobacteraceae bacterium]
MRVCRSCGRENPDESDFCSCGEYLRWEPTNFLPSVAAPDADVAHANGSASGPAETAAPGAGGARDAAARAAGGAVGGAPSRPADGHPMSPQDLDPNITLGPEMILPGAGGTGGGGVGGTGSPPPGAAALSLRLPGDDGADGGQVSVSVQPGARVTVLGLIRNQSDVVDNFDLSVRGLPEDWWTIAPATAYLVPYGSGGTYEQEVQVHLHPPRTPQAQARQWSFEVVAVSRAFGGEVAAAAASVTIEPYTELGTELRPERASGRLKARYVLTVYNKANARTEVDLAAEDTDAECDFRFAEPRIALEPGNGMECPFTVFPPKQKWIGRSVDRQFQLTATPVGTDGPVPPRMATFRQRPWLPWWMSVVGPLLAAAVVVVIMLLPKQTVVPNLKGQPSAFAAQKLLNKIGLKLGKTTSKVVPKQKAGSVIDQSPAAGAKAKKGTVVDVVVVTGSGKVTVPPLVGLTLGLAQQKLIQAGLALGTVQPQPPNPNGKISSQLPLASTVVVGGFAVNLFQAAPAAAGTSKKTKTAIAAAATALGAGAAGAAAAATGKSSGSSLTPVQAQAGLGPIPIPKVPTNAAQAAQALANLGLVPQPIKQLSTAPVGQVAGTVPAAGSKVPKGAHVALLVSSGSPQLAFDNGTQVNVIDPTSGKVTAQVPPGVGAQVEPAWSLNGQHLVYEQNGQLVMVEPGVKGSAPAIITHPPQGTSDRNPAFAPTEKGIVVAYIQGAGNNAHQLCFASVTKFSQSNTCTNAPGFALGGQLSWSPDGSTILVLGTRNNGANFGLLSFSSSVPFSGQASNWGQPTPQTDASVAGQGIFAGAFSPDGKKMALVAGSNKAGFNLFIVKPNNFNPTQQNELPVTACQISWRSDSQELAVMQANGQCGPQATGKIVGVDLSNPRNLTTLVPLGAHPAWQSVPGG